MPPKLTEQLWNALPADVRSTIEDVKRDIVAANRSQGKKNSIARRGLRFDAKDCFECGRTYQPTNGRQLRCNECRAPKRPDPMAGWRDKITAKRTQTLAATGGRLTFPDRVCVACDEPFSPNAGGQKWCSKPCRNFFYRLRRLGMTIEEYRTMRSAQAGACALCGEVWKGWGAGLAELHIDHCHETGRIRGLLCGDCNTALGRFGDDPARLRAAADYLEG